MPAESTHSERHPDPIMRRCQRVLMMVHELHKRGYQRLRIVSGLSPSGCHWRCQIISARYISRENGTDVICDQKEQLVASYTSGMGNRYFNWEDASQDTARQLADKFIERFPRIAQEGVGADWAYTGWYVEMLGFAEQGELPVTYADWMGNDEPNYVAALKDRKLPYPPGGEAAVVKLR